MIKFFTYGTFRRGECRHYILQKFVKEFSGITTTAPKYRLVNLGSFPGILEGGTNHIVGEVYYIEDDALPMLDMIESHPSFFLRTNIELSDGSTAIAYIFPHNVESNKDISSGDWVNKG